MNNLEGINKNLAEAVNIDNNNRKLVYKHRTKDYYLLYCGGICNVSQCFEVNENFLLRQSHQFSNFYALKDFILHNYPKSELVMELVKYESKNFIDIIDVLEKGDLKEVVIDFDFTDSESDFSDSCEEEEKEETSSVESDTDTCSTDWIADWDYDSFNNNVISNWTYNCSNYCWPVKLYGEDKSIKDNIGDISTFDTNTFTNTSSFDISDFNTKTPFDSTSFNISGFNTDIFNITNTFAPTSFNISGFNTNIFNTTYDNTTYDNITNTFDPTSFNISGFNTHIFNTTYDNKTVDPVFDNTSFDFVFDNKTVDPVFGTPLFNNTGFNNINNNPFSEPDKTLKEPVLFSNIKPEEYDVSQKVIIHSDSIIKKMEAELLANFSKQALDVAQEAAGYANYVSALCEEEIKSIHTYNQNYLDVVEEEIMYCDSDDYSDDDIILPNMNYFKKF